MNNEFEVIIIGAGPCGIGCAEKLKEAGVNFAVVEGYIPGGKVNIAPRVDNYPFEHEIPGPDLAMKFADRLFKLKVPFINKEVKSLTKPSDFYNLTLKDGSVLTTKYVVVATGTKEMKMGLEKEDKLLGHGISYCAVCDGHFFKGKDIAVLIKGNHALSEAIYLSNLVKKLYLIHEFNDFEEDKKLIQKLKDKDNVVFVMNSKPEAILGEEKVEGLVIRDLVENKQNTLELQGIFPFIGQIPNTQFVDVDVQLSENGAIVVDKTFESNLHGLFAGGDVLPRDIRQIYLAEHDGTVIAKNILKYIRG